MSTYRALPCINAAFGAGYVVPGIRWRYLEHGNIWLDIGLFRDPQTLEAVEYYFKAPADVADRLVIVMDPMLATANSAVAAIDRL